MTEKEKMLAGKAYMSFGEELFNERQRAKELIYEFNNLPPDKLEERNAIIKNLLGRVGNNYYFEPPFRCDYGYNIEIGDNFYCNYNLVILDCCKITIGDNCLIAPNVGLYGAGHPLHHEPRNKGYEYGLPITIGDNVWIGGNVVVNPGVTIGDCCVIGSGSVVNKDIPNGSLAAGNPCKVIRAITDEEKEYYYRNRKI